MLTFLAWPHRILRAIKIRIEAQARKNISPILTNCRMCAGVTSVHLREGKMLEKRASKHNSGFQKAWLVH